MQSLKFESLQSLVDYEFWYDLENKKLLEYKLDNLPKPIYATYTTGRSFQSNVIHNTSGNTVALSSKIRLGEQAFNENTQSNLFTFQIPGTLYNANTIEEFNNYDKKELIRSVALDKIYEKIKDKSWLLQPNEIIRFLLLTFADLKQHSFYYWFAFPALVFEKQDVTFENITSLSKLNEKLCENIRVAIEEFRSIVNKSQQGFFFILVDKENEKVQVKPLKDWKEVYQLTDKKVYLSFADPSSLAENPNWILRNYLLASSLTFKRNRFDVLCYREDPSKRDITSSIILENVTVDFGVELSNDESYDLLSRKKEEISVVGWEKNAKGKLGPRFANVGSMMDPIKLAESSVTLNLQLMKWRMFPSLNLELLSQTKCLLIGSGTLGCHVARNLMAWGIFNITFVDRTKVSFSNPVRQPLYEYEDCLNGGRNKAECAAEHLKKIYPKVNANHVALDIPMPGHFVTNRENVKSNVEKLEDLIDKHDVVFLLTDTRESRWLPSLIAIKKKKIVINSALGFESYLVMRYGVQHQKERLGCYFCNDVVAPVNSMKDRTLDQQCTVTRPGVSAIAGSLAVEMLVALLHHPLKECAPAVVPGQLQHELTSDLGIVPHQIRGSVTNYQTNLLFGVSYNQCTCCSNTVIEHYEKDGFDFLEKVFQDPKMLEELTGLKALHEKTMKMFESMSIEEDEEEVEEINSTNNQPNVQQDCASSGDDDFEVL
ncbi:hypothetical protein ABK040_005408 [Willaertia magna]